MVAPTGYENMVIGLLKEGVPHGWGELKVEWYTKANITTVTIDFGKKYIFKIEKEIKFDENIL